MKTDWQAAARRILAESSTAWLEDHRGLAFWDEAGTSICIAYGNDGYAEDWRSQVEVGVLRKYLRAKDVQELGFAVSEDGYSWAMIIGANHSDQMRDVLSKAWMLASWMPGRGEQTGDVSEIVEEIWSQIADEIKQTGTVRPY